eukprot:5556728-Amphidinium_carterae.1
MEQIVNDRATQHSTEEISVVTAQTRIVDDQRSAHASYIRYSRVLWERWKGFDWVSPLRHHTMSCVSRVSPENIKDYQALVFKGLER